MLEHFQREKEAAAAAGGAGAAGAAIAGVEMAAAAAAETAPPRDSADGAGYADAEDSREKTQKTATRLSPPPSPPTTPPPTKTTKELDDAAFNERDHFLRWVGGPMRVVSWGMVGWVPEYDFEHGGLLTRINVCNEKGVSFPNRLTLICFQNVAFKLGVSVNSRASTSR